MRKVWQRLRRVDWLTVVLWLIIGFILVVFAIGALAILTDIDRVAEERRGRVYELVCYDGGVEVLRDYIYNDNGAWRDEETGAQLRWDFDNCVRYDTDRKVKQ